jgi:SAM-dependent methyltransferase
MEPKEFYNSHAERWAKNARDVQNITHVFVEVPAILKYFKNKLKGKRVLCIGCGSGDECKMFHDMGAKEVVGVDISDKLVAYCKLRYSEIRFEVGSWSDFRFIPNLGKFDYVYSGFAIHYVDDWTGVCNDVAFTLKDKGEFIFSTVHPIKNSVEKEIDGAFKRKVFGIVKELGTKEVVRKYGNYFKEGESEINLFSDGVKVRVYKKNYASIVNELSKSVLRIRKFIEPVPTSGAKVVDLSSYIEDSHVPSVLICILQK